MKQLFNKMMFPLTMLLCAQISFAQNGTVTGIISDAKSKETLPGAEVMANGSGTAADDNGNYTISLPPGKYDLEFSYIGYESKKITVTVKPGGKQTLNIELGDNVMILDVTTVTATKHEKPLGEVTVSLDVVKPKLAENVNATQVGDVVQKVPGVSIIDGQANIRGGSGYSYGAGSRVLMLLNDMPILDGAAGLPNWNDLPVENLEQIEVVKGAASALYGSSALNGIINIRTAEARSKPVLKFSTFGSIFERPSELDSAGVKLPTNSTHYGQTWPKEFGMSMAYRQRFKRLDLVMSSFYSTMDDFKATIYNRRFRVNTDIKYRFTDKFFAGVRVNVNMGNSGSFLLQQDAFRNAFSPREGTATFSKVLRFSIDPYITFFDGSENKHKIMLRWLRTGNDNGNNQANFADFIYGEYQFARTFEKLGDLSFITGIVGNHTIGGGALYGVVPEQGNQKHQATNVAGYLQLDKKLFNRLNLSAGVRYEAFWTKSSGIYVTNFLPNPVTGLFDIPNIGSNLDSNYNESRPVFRFGANYQPFKYTYIRASWGQGYRFPTMAERYVVTSLPLDGFALNILPNTRLRSETGWSAELGIKQGFQVTKNWQGYVDVSGFWTEYQDMMEFNLITSPLFGFQSRNVGNTQIYGLEASIMGQGKIGQVKFNTILGYTYIDPTFKDWVNNGSADSSSSANFNVLKYRFRHQFKFDGEVFWKNFSLGGSVQYNSYMEAIDEAFNLVLTGVRRYRELYNGVGTTLVDFRAGYQVNKHIKVSFVVKNALNDLIYFRPALPEAPRNFTIRLDFNVFGEEQ